MMLTSVDDLEAALDRGELEARWLLHPGSWFELLEVARRCGDAGARLELSIRDGDDAVPMAALPIAEFTAAYETIRDWWPQLSGESRPRSLGPDAYNQLAGALRAELAATADRRLAGSDRGDARLGFPPLDHPLLQDDEDALRFFRAFLPLDDSESIRSAALGYAAAEDAVERVRGNVWLRALLQRQLAVRWDSRLQAVLVEAMADPADRADLVEHQRTALAAVGLEWLSTQLVEEFGLLLPPPKQRPFKIPRRTDARPEWRDTADVTVVIPSYRHERYIAATIASVLAQSAPALRVLVADDRSPDGTVAAARAIEDPRLEVRVNETNVGLGNSVLAALAAVETPFVALLNSDDLFHPKRLEKCLAVLRDDTGCDLVSTGLALIDRDGKRLGPSNTSALFHGRNVRDWVRWYEASTPASWRKDALFGALLERNFLATSSNIVCRTDWLRAHGDALRSLKYCLDWQLFLDAAREQRLRWLPDKLIAYRLHPSNTVWFEPEKRWAYSLEVNRVAARAVRDHIAPLPDDSAERVLLALQDVAAHLRHNTEVDWTGLYLNELIGGYRLEQHAGESPRVAELAADLERTAWQTSDPATAAERRRAGALASKFAATRDEVYSLQSRDEWQRRRIEEDNARLRQAQDRFDATQRALDAKQAEAAALEQRLQELQQEHAATFGALQHTTGELAAERNSHADTANRLTATTDALAQRESELAQRTADLAQRTADLAQRSDELAHSKRAIAGLEAIRRRQEEQRRQRERVLGQTIRRRTAAQYLLANEIAQQRLAVEAQRRTSLRLRGMRIQAGATTLEFARRFAKWRRKLGTLLGTRPPGLPRSRHAPPVIATAMAAAAERAELAALAAEAAAAALPIVLRDGNSATAAALPEVPAGSFGTWTFPERAARHWRIFARRHPGRCEPLLQSLAEALGGDTAGAIAAMGPALAFARTARTARTALLIAGSDPIEQFRIAVAARLLELPWVAVVAQLAATDEPTANWTRRELGTAALLIARSAGLQQTLVGTGIDAERIVVRPGPIVPAAAPTAAGEGRPRLLVCGRMAAGIGWESLLAAISVLCDRGWHLRLDVLAEVDPTAVDSLSAAAVFRANLPTLDVSANVELVHAATAVQIEQLLAGGPAVFVAPWQPRAAAATALDTGVLAAMSAGLPIVATDVPAIAAAVADGREALLVPPGDERALTDATGRLLREPGLRAELGARARERFFAEFAPELSRATLGERLRRLLPPGSRT